MNYKLLVLDLDGTLTNTKKEITTRNREILIQTQQQGTRLVLASGRPTYGIAPLADELQMSQFDGYILSYNGGKIIDWKSKEILYANVLPNAVIPQLYECAKKNKLAILTYDKECIVTENPEDEYVKKEAFLNKMEVRKSTDFLTDIHLPVPKCLIVGDPDKLIAVESELSIRLQGQISVYRSEPYFLELVPLGIDKAQSLTVLLEKLDMKREDMVAVGDGYNDLSMIKFAGLGVAMANAQEPVKKAADYITLSNDEDGVAAVVERYFSAAK
ncbi:Cof-type HAD-IIB family hydrolase [Bacteroides nordii]|uniref:Cof-type HAD-IIB family hydrolase n=1 Tax=Bacteroides nordii TaxID=291645 RepID=UPI002430CD4D|nr:Cof-type HAD-IIB family hydrolase [Bacteroides nordii]